MIKDFEVISCDRFGNNTFTHANAVITAPARDELNNEGSLSFQVPAFDPGLPYLKPIAREIQLWVDGVMIWWGPIIRGTCIDLVTTVIECAGPLYYFSKLYFGKAQRTNYLTNGSFDDGTLNGWQPVGVTANVVDEWGALPGQTYQANLYQLGPGDDTFITQSIIVPGGNYYSVHGWFQIRTDSTYIAPALEGRGLYIERMSQDLTHAEEVNYYAITDDTPRGIFTEASCGISTPPGANWTLRVRCYATLCANATPVAPRPPGSIIWDDISVTLMESVSYPNNDLGQVFNAIVNHAQNSTYGKVDLNIAQTSPATGNFVDRTYQFADHNNIGDAMQEFANQGLCDYGIEYLSATSRACRLYAPQKGTVHTDFTLELDAQIGINSVPTITRDGDKTITSVIMIDPNGSGPGRDEAGAVNTSDTNGVVLEEVTSPLTTTHHDLLQMTANSYLASKYRVIEVPELLVSTDYINTIFVGDTVKVLIQPPFSSESIDASFRVIAREIDPQAKTFRLIVNPV